MCSTITVTMLVYIAEFTYIPCWWAQPGCSLVNIVCVHADNNFVTSEYAYTHVLTKHLDQIISIVTRTCQCTRIYYVGVHIIHLELMYFTVH